MKHGPLEALITKDEETGMYGAFGLKPGTVNGEILLNLDSEDEGELYIGCAGGMDVTATLEYKEVAPEEGDIAVKVTLKKACVVGIPDWKSMKDACQCQQIAGSLYPRGSCQLRSTPGKLGRW